MLATPTPGFGIGVNHHPRVNHDLSFKLRGKMLDLLLILLMQASCLLSRS
jgi:hypothetical protein